MTTVMALLVVAAGAALLRWTDLFHLTILLPMLLIALLLGHWRSRTAHDDENVHKSESDEEATVVRILRGGVAGAAVLMLSAAGVSTAARTPLYGWFYDSDLETVFGHVDLLERAGAYNEAVRLLDERRAGVLSPTARDRLDDRRVRALMREAEQRQGDDQVAVLRRALAETDGARHPDLRDLIEARLRAVTSERLLARVHLAVEQAERGIVVRVPDVLFHAGRDQLIEEARTQVQEIAHLLNAAEYRKRRVRVEGHADSTGPAAANQRLSESRASSVAAALIALGVDADRVRTRGFGNGRPIAPNDTEEGRARNRRVEVVLLNESAE